MELALYCPVYGFYETEEDKIGRKGDFFTSVSVGSVFGELLGFQFSEWLAEIRTVSASQNEAKNVQIVETGAYSGRLAKDILGWFRMHEPELFQSLEYWIVEPLDRLRLKQTEMLADFGAVVRWASSIQEVNSGTAVEGVIFSNELLDAMPVRRLGWDAVAKCWFEWGVALQGERFVWARMPELSIGLPDSFFSAQLLSVLPEGYTIELGSAAANWWKRAAGVLKRGKLIAFDYGMTAEELFVPERIQGTLRTYSKHRAGSDLLENPGEQDITAHVNFTQIQNKGEEAGLKTDCFCSQEKFLVQIAEKTWKQAERFSPWDSARRRQFQTLVHPQHLGRSFKVLVQSR
jgi:SAM-dependent MidA family methyltransferase